MSGASSGLCCSSVEHLFLVPILSSRARLSSKSSSSSSNMDREGSRPVYKFVLLRAESVYVMTCAFTLNFYFNSFSSALLSCDLLSCDSSHDPFHSFTYHMITHFLILTWLTISLVSHTFILCVPTWVPLTLVTVCFTYYLWLRVIPYDSLYCSSMTLLGIPVSMTPYYYTAHLFLDIVQ